MMTLHLIVFVAVVAMTVQFSAMLLGKNNLSLLVACLLS